MSCYRLVKYMGRELTGMPRSIDRMMYIDDSGRPQSGLAVYGWIEFEPDRWTAVLESWLRTRKQLWRQFRVPVTKELHATAFINGRGNLSNDIPPEFIHNGVPYKRNFGRVVAETCLDTLRSTEGLRIGSVYRHGKPESFDRTKRELYADLVAWLEEELEGSDSLGLVFMDGDGSDPRYRQIHRQLKLRKRRIIEDAILIDSAGSQLVQMADLVAWVANSTIDQHPGNQFAAHWYETYLAERDPFRTPREL